MGKLGPPPSADITLTFWERLRGNLIGSMIWLLLWLIVRTLRITFIAPEHIDTAREKAHANGTQIAWAFWHGRQSVLLDHHGRGEPVVILSSLSNDGQIQAALLRRFGYWVTRGSSSRGGARGLINMIRSVRMGYEVGFAVDGPKGPRHEVKPGVLLLARKVSTWIVPATASATPAWHIRSWDRTMIPRPFARAVIVYGEPVHVPAGVDDAGLEACRKQLEDELRRITDVADQYFLEAATRAA